MLSIFSLVITAACIRYTLLKKTQEKLDVELKITRVQQEVKANSHEDSQKKPIYGEVSRNSIDSNNYEPQYDANNDYQIFGVGNTKTGGVQTMKEKMNMADKPGNESSSEEDNIDRDNSSSNLPSKPSSKGSNERSTTVAGSMPFNSEEHSSKNQLPEDKEIHSDIE